MEQKKSPITVSQMDFHDYGKGGKVYQKYIYAECSYCETLTHLTRVSVFCERDEKGEMILSTVGLEFPTDWYFAHEVHKIAETKFGRFLQKFQVAWLRIKMAIKVLTGGRLHIFSGGDFSFPAAKELARKVIEIVEEMEAVK